MKQASLYIEIGKHKAYEYDLLELIARCGYSKSEVKRLMEQRAIKLSVEAK